MLQSLSKDHISANKSSATTVFLVSVFDIVYN